MRSYRDVEKSNEKRDSETCVFFWINCHGKTKAGGHGSKREVLWVGCVFQSGCSLFSTHQVHIHCNASVKLWLPNMFLVYRGESSVYDGPFSCSSVVFLALDINSNI